MIKKLFTMLTEEEMQQNKKYKAYFVGVSDVEKKEFKDSKCVMIISVGQKYHEYGELHAAINLVNKHFSFVNILVCDTLQRHSIAIEKSDHSDEQLCLLSKNYGDQWINRNKRYISSFTIPYQLSRWDEWINHKLFKEYYDKVYNLYENDNVYKETVVQIANQYLLRKDITKITNRFLAIDLCIKYLLEESAVACLWVKLGYQFDVYPTRSNLAMIMAYSKLAQHQVDFEPKSLMLNIKKISKTSVVNLKTEEFKNIATNYILTHAPGHIYWKDLNGVFLGCNEEHAKYFGFDNPKDIIGKTNADFLDEETANHISDIDNEVMTTGKEYIVEETVNGSQYFLSKKISLRNNKNNIIGLLGTSINITAQKKLEVNLEKTVEELKKALAAKTEFLNNMSHEIRTPVTGFLSISEGLVKHWAHLDERKKLSYMMNVESSAKRLASLIGNLLDLAKFNSGKMVLDFYTIDLQQAINEMIEECYVLYMNDKKVKFQFINKAFDTTCMGDNERIAQVLRNIFFNAIKFSNHNEEIIVTLYNAKMHYDDIIIQGLQCTVMDEGVGIPENELNAIFEPFFMSTRTKTRAGGTGLGLSIIKKIIEAHHGKIWVENNVKKGASFHFVIPIYYEKNRESAEIISVETINNKNTSDNITTIDKSEQHKIAAPGQSHEKFLSLL